MAIKVTGTTVINDSRELENATGLNNVIRKPTITSPTAAETDTDFIDLTITGSQYDAIFENTRDYREFQIDLSTGDFSSPVVSQQVNADSFTVSSELDGGTEHKVRIRDVDTDGNVSEFSDVISFTTVVNIIDGVSAGDSFCGGFYMGAINAASTCYALIVAPNATGCNCCQWKTSKSSTSGACSRDDGFANTYNGLANSDHPAGNWTATRTINGFSDWYLPARDELRLVYDNGGGGGSGTPFPSGEDFALDVYWSSTENTRTPAYVIDFNDDNEIDRLKDTTQRVRAFRRVTIQ